MPVPKATSCIYSINGKNVTYYDYDNGKYITIQCNDHNDVNLNIFYRTARHIEYFAEKNDKDNAGNIVAKSVDDLLFSLFKYIRGSEEITKVKPLFDIAMAETSDGGTNITPKEQSRILNVIQSWDCGWGAKDITK